MVRREQWAQAIAELQLHDLGTTVRKQHGASAGPQTRMMPFSWNGPTDLTILQVGFSGALCVR